MSVIIAENVGHFFGDQEIFRGVNFRIAGGDRIGLVGPNGEGKTTLLRIVGGLLEPTAGDVHRSRGLRIGYLPQDPPALEGHSIHDAMLDVFADLRRMETELHELTDRLDDADPQHIDRYGALQEEFEAAGGYGYHNRIQQVLTGLGFPREMWEQPLAKLSGGQRTRVYLARLLLENPDVLLLDEPTNHLDLDSAEWLENWLLAYAGAFVVVSHDRYLLDRVTVRTWEIGARRLEEYRGAYTKYLKLRADRHRERLSQWEAQQEYVEKTQEFIRIHMAGQRTKEAQGRRSRLERFLRDEAVERPQEQRTIHLDLPAGPRTGDLVLSTPKLAAGYAPDKPLVETGELELVRGQRVAVVGSNGSGKTTLLRTLLGQLKPVAGDVRLGANVRVGYLSQTHADLDPASTALDAVMAAGDGCKADRARSVLGSLLLSGDDAFKRIDQLSGGQRSRIVLARLVVMNANLLLLDEPTNHLDIASTEIIQDALKRFEGTVLFVSHDRYLIQAIATHVWAVHDGRVHRIIGRWDEYLKWRDGVHAAGPATTTTRAKRERKAEYGENKKLANELKRLRRRHEQVEKEIERVEEELAKLGDAISTAAETGQMDVLHKLSAEHQQQSERLKALWDEWEHVGEQIEWARRPRLLSTRRRW